MIADSAPSALLDVLPNLRDLGGLRTDSGGRTRPGVLLRSAAPLAGDRLPALPIWPPVAVLDLRGADELAGLPHPLAGPGTAVHALPLLDQHITAGPRSVDWSRVPDLATAYRGFLLRGAARLATVAELVAAADGPVLVHCTAGKDRTGVAVAVLLRAAGVSRAEILRDYRRTEPELPAILARAAHLTLGVDPTHVQRLMGVPLDAMTQVLDLLDEAQGGAAGWLRGHGVPGQVLHAWQRRLVG